ncbi:MAG: transposase [Candidatus Nealsonbacteria bacterium]|nr:transposase [Candidatus Nealsonbacteria bacterium]
MRKEKFTEGNYIHVYNRGNRKEDIVRDTKDKWRFMQALRFFNDSHTSAHLFRVLSRSKPGFDQTVFDQKESVFEMGWPPNWPERDPLVKILCYCLVPNHFHLLLKEIREGGIAKFMHKLGLGYGKYFNLKYNEVGRIFQGPYKAKLVDKDVYLKHLCVYIQALNVLELFPGGFEAALRNFNEAMKFLDSYLFSSHLDYIGLRNSLIIDRDILNEFFPKPEDYKKFVYDSISAKDFKNILEDLKLE